MVRVVVWLGVAGVLAAGACGGPPRPSPAPSPSPSPQVVPSPGAGAVPVPVPAHGSAAAQVAPSPVPPPPSDPRLAADLASFDKVWQTVADTFWDPTFGGVDWNAVRAELRPRVEASRDRAETRALIDRALDRLGKSHFAVWGPRDRAAGARVGNASPGFEVRLLEGIAYIYRIEAGSSASRHKDLRPGLQLLAVDGVALAPRLLEIRDRLPGSSLMPLVATAAIDELLRGPDGTLVKLTVGDGTPRGRRELTVARAPPAGAMVSFGNLGPAPLIYEARWLDDHVAYIRLSIFLDPATVVPAIARDLVQFARARGVIFDLRGNPGGIGGMAMGIAGHLVSDANKKLGTMHLRQTKLDFVINPQAQRYAGKLAILIDDLSASTSEIFAGGLQDLGRARVFGRRSPGAALPSIIDTLPNGDRFQYAIAGYVSASGASLEGNGVTPDEAIRLDPKALRAGKDPDVAAATRWIKES